ncbi:unnamed protein product [Urochloa humidicola]
MAPVLEKRIAKSEEEGEVFGGGGAMGGGSSGITEGDVGTADAGSEGEVFGGGDGGGGITECEAAAVEAGSTGEPCAAGVTMTKRPGSIEEEDALAVSKRPRTNEEDVPKTEAEADYDSEEEYVRQCFIYKKMLTRPHNAPGKDGKRRTVLRLDKESIEFRMSQPPPTPYPRMSEEHIARLEQLMPGCRIRAEEDECTALGQKLIDRDAEMRRQYALYGYAELEFTDNDEDDDVDERMKTWRSMRRS